MITICQVWSTCHLLLTSYLQYLRCDLILPGKRSRKKKKLGIKIWMASSRQDMQGLLVLESPLLNLKPPPILPLHTHSIVSF